MLKKFVDKWCKRRTEIGRKEMLDELNNLIELEVDRRIFEVGENLEKYDDSERVNN